MTTEFQIPSTEPLIEGNADGLELRVYYEDPEAVIVLKRVADGAVRSDRVHCTHRPIFGFDVDDMTEILRRTEQLAVELEQ